MAVLAQDEAEYEKFDVWRRAMGRRVNITFVSLSQQGLGDVLLEGSRSPVKVRARILQGGTGAPARKTLGASMKDEAATETTSSEENETCRELPRLAQGLRTRQLQPRQFPMQKAQGRAIPRSFPRRARLDLT